MRAQFDLPAEGADFAAFVLARHPAPVRAKIEEYRRGLDASPEYVPPTGDPDLAVRTAAGRFLGASPRRSP